MADLGKKWRQIHAISAAGKFVVAGQKIAGDCVPSAIFYVRSTYSGFCMANPALY